MNRKIFFGTGLVGMVVLVLSLSAFVVFAPPVTVPEGYTKGLVSCEPSWQTYDCERRLSFWCHPTEKVWYQKDCGDYGCDRDSGMCQLINKVPTAEEKEAITIIKVEVTNGTKSGSYRYKILIENTLDKVVFVDIATDIRKVDNPDEAWVCFNREKTGKYDPATGKGCHIQIRHPGVISIPPGKNLTFSPPLDIPVFTSANYYMAIGVWVAETKSFGPEYRGKWVGEAGYGLDLKCSPNAPVEWCEKLSEFYLEGQKVTDLNLEAPRVTVPAGYTKTTRCGVTWQLGVYKCEGGYSHVCANDGFWYSKYCSHGCDKATGKCKAPPGQIILNPGDTYKIKSEDVEKTVVCQAEGTTQPPQPTGEPNGVCNSEQEYINGQPCDCGAECGSGTCIGGICLYICRPNDAGKWIDTDYELVEREGTCPPA